MPDRKATHSFGNCVPTGRAGPSRMPSVRSFALAVAAVVTLAPAGATDLGLTVATDYMMRGVRQTWSGPAYQGLVEHGFKTGIFAGLWASRVSFRAEDPRNVELDYFAGYRKRLRPDVAFDITATREQKHRALDAYEAQFTPQGLEFLHRGLDVKERQWAEAESFSHGEALLVLSPRHLHVNPDADRM